MLFRSPHQLGWSAATAVCSQAAASAGAGGAPRAAARPPTSTRMGGRIERGRGGAVGSGGGGSAAAAAASAGGVPSAATLAAPRATHWPRSAPRGIERPPPRPRPAAGRRHQAPRAALEPAGQPRQCRAPRPPGRGPRWVPEGVALCGVRGRRPAGVAAPAPVSLADALDPAPPLVALWPRGRHPRPHLGRAGHRVDVARGCDARPSRGARVARPRRARVPPLPPPRAPRRALLRGSVLVPALPQRGQKCKRVGA